MSLRDLGRSLGHPSELWAIARFLWRSLSSKEVDDLGGGASDGPPQLKLLNNTNSNKGDSP